MYSEYGGIAVVLNEQIEPRLIEFNGGWEQYQNGDEVGRKSMGSTVHQDLTNISTFSLGNQGSKKLMEQRRLVYP